MEILPFILFGAIVAAVVIYARIQKRKKIQALESIARRLGYRFYEDDPEELHETHSHHELFQNGHDREASYILEGNHGDHPLYCFDYQYVTGSGKNRTPHQFSCVLLETPYGFKRLFVRPEGVFDKVGGILGFDDIDFESAEFSRKYYVQGEDKKFVYAVIHPRMMEFLLQFDDLHFELAGPSVLLYRDGSMDPDRVESMITVMKDFLGQFPEYLLRELKGT